MGQVTVAELLERARQQDWPTSSVSALARGHVVEPRRESPSEDSTRADEPPAALVRRYMRTRMEGTL